MKSWKDQLRDLKSALRGSGHGKERGDEPPKIDFDPPPAWLAGGQPTPKKPPARNPVPKPAAPVAAVVAPATKPPSSSPPPNNNPKNPPAAAAAAPTAARAEHRHLWHGLLPTVECRR